ncbi:MAG: hypothetical protein LBS63_01505 [Prevotellaceae bacterium]|jgi:hypothetical protein|nr:hypothetical protein [Prevotellaceae bacterium]
MVVKRSIILSLFFLCSINITNAQGYETIVGYIVFLNHKNNIEAGIELFLQQHTEYHNYNEWEKILRGTGLSLHPKTDSILYNLKQQNYWVDIFHQKKNKKKPKKL